MEGIKVPVSLEIILSSMAKVREAIANLKPESKSWRELLGILLTLTKEADKFGIMMQKPFASLALFNAAEKSIDKMDEALSKAELTISRIKFSDIKLTPELLETFKALLLDISNIEQLIKLFKINAKNELQTGPAWDDIIKIDPNAATRTFDELLKTVRLKNLKLLEEYERAKLASENFAQVDKMASFTEKVFTKADPLSEKGTLSDQFEQYFTKNNKTGNFDFARGLKSAFFEWAHANLTLTDAQWKLIEGKNGLAVIDAFKTFLKDALAAVEAIHGKNGEYVLKEADAASKLASSRIAADALGQKVDQIANQLTGFSSALEGSTRKLEEWERALTEATRASNDFSSPIALMQAGLLNLKITLGQTNELFLRMQRAQLSFNSMKMAIVNFMGFSQVLNLTKKAIKDAVNHIKELDSVMNKISIVTNMSTADLWNLVDAYSKMAQAYGVSIKGAYEVSQIYYQQGLQTKDVLTLTNETLKLAKISGLDYAQTTDYMTTALRGFKMEMSEAATVVDVYSNLAAHTAVSLEELAVAMSKTASSMESVGTTFEEASAMIGTMVAVTRESATNIGSAMKSIASRYGELTKDPTKLVDEDGEAMAFNKVDAALQSVGISMKTVDGLFREFTDVIVELGEKWDQLDSTQQRYIATQFAGNRQQSRFLALVSNVDLLKSNLDVAMNSEDTGTLLALKALDSVESKIELVRVAYQQFYTTIGAETIWKGFLDGAKSVIDTLNRMPKLFGKIPVAAINVIGSIITLVKSLGIHLLSGIANTFGLGFIKGLLSQVPSVKATTEELINTITLTTLNKTGEVEAAGLQLGTALNNGLKQAIFKRRSMDGIVSKDQVADWSTRALATIGLNSNELSLVWSNIATEMQLSGVLTKEGFDIIKTGGQEAIAIIERLKASITGEGNAAKESKGKLATWAESHQKGLSSLMSFGSALNIVATAIDTTTLSGKKLSGAFMAAGGTITTVAALIKAAGESTKTIPWVAIASGIIAAVSGIALIIKANSLEAQLEEATAKAEELNNKAKELKANFNTIDTGIKKLKKLEETRYDSAEAAAEYLEQVNELGESFPQLILSFDEAGNVVLNAANMEATLTDARLKAAQAALAAARAEATKAELNILSKKDELQYSADRLKTFGDRTSGDVTRLIATTTDERGKRIKVTGHTSSTDLYGYLSENLNNETEKALWNWLNSEELDLGSKALTYTKRDTDIVATLIRNMGEAIEKELYNEATNYSTMLDMAMLILNWEPAADFKEDLEKARTRLTEVTPLENQLTSANKLTVYNWIMLSSFADNAFISKSTGLFSIALSLLYDVLGNDFSDANLMKEGTKILSPLNTLWNNLSTSVLENVNKILNNPNNYTSKDLESALGIFADLAPEWIYKIFAQQTLASQDLLNNKLKLVYNVDESTLDFSDEYLALEEIINEKNKDIILSELKFLNEALSQILNLSNRGLDTTDFATEIINFINLIKEVSTETKTALLNQFLENGFTREGILNTLDYIRSIEELLDIDFSVLTDLSKTILPNIKLTSETVFSNFTEGWKDLDKFFSSLSKGFDVNEKDQIIAQGKQFGLDADWFSSHNFVLDGDVMKSTVADINSAADNILAYYINKFTNMLSELNEAFDIAKDSMTYYHEDGEPDATKFNIGAMLTVLGGEFTNWFEQDENGEWLLRAVPGQSIEETIAKLRQALSNAYTSTGELLEKYKKYIELNTTLLNKTTAWARGDYSSFVDAGIYTDLLTANNRLLELASGLDKMTDSERALPDVKSAFTSLQQSYNTLISDILNKGFNNIDLRDYDYLIGIVQNDLNGSYQEFINTYARRAGLSAAEINDLLIQAIEKDQAKVNSDILKDLTFVNEDQFTTSLEGMKDLAKAFEVKAEDFNDWINNYYDAATGKATIKVSELLSKYDIDLKSINDFNLMVLESIDGLFSSLTSNISNALKGNLDAKGTKNLLDTINDLLKPFNKSIDLSFTKTKDGYKLSVEQAEQLYEELLTIDALTAQIVLDALNESIDESIIGAKNLNKEIAQLRSTTESDDFKFMSNKIPSGLNNPLNYFSNWGKAWKILLDSFKTSSKDKGKIAYEDFYNIVSEMGRLASETGKKINLGAAGFVTSAEDAAALIEKGANYLTVAADGSIKVDLTKLGIDFSTGGEAMAKGINDGIKDFADSLVTMLDGMIQLMETIVAMEQLDDIDIDKKGIDFGDLFEIEYDESSGERVYKEFSEGYNKFRDYVLTHIDKEKYPKQFNQDLYDGINSTKIKVGDQEFIFGDMLKMEPSKLAEHAKDGLGDAYAAVLLAYKAAALSGNYDTDNIMASIKEVLAGTGFEGDIDIGELRLTFHLGVVLERDKDGNFIVGDTTYKDIGTALKALTAGEVTTIKDAVKSYNPETGDVTFTAGEFSYISKYDVEKGYEVEFSDGDKVTSLTKEGINAAINIWAEKNNIDTTDLSLPTNSKHLFTYVSKTGVTMSYEIDVLTGEIKYISSSGIGDEKTGNEAIEIEKGAKAYGDKIAQLAANQTGTVTSTATINNNITATLGADATVAVDISGKTLTLIGEPGNIEYDEDILLESGDITLNIKVDKNETQAALQANQDEATSGVILNIKNDGNLTQKALEENLAKAAKNATQNIIYTQNQVAAAITENVLYGKDHPVVQEVISKHTTISDSSNSDTNHVTIVRLGGGAGISRTKEEQATGNVGLAKGTLMGELGPELVVSRGHYFVAGLNGAEFVNLDADAIVFNHLQTKALLEKGMSNSRGKAVTSEKNAISYATGNVNGGPAKASASDALAALKQLRNQWKTLANLGVQDLAGKAGGGGGGGGNKQFIKDLERWYNWLQEIAKLEKKINYEESLRSKMLSDFKRDGREYFDSQMKSLEYLKREIQVQKDLVKELTVFFKQRREELNSSKNPFSQFWTYDEEGLIKYTNKQFTYNGLTFNGGFEALAEINKTDAYGNLAYNADLQLAMMTAFLGKDVVDKYRKDADGKERESADILEAMWSSAEGNNAEMQGLFDSIQDGENAILDYSKLQNDILHEIEDNLIAVEDKVLKAIEDTRQREIDELLKERDAIEESSKNLIDGLSNQLLKERDMYSRLKENDELEKLQRRLAILQRSGGSASLIASLLSLITDLMQDKYFDEQEKQINTLQEASDNLLARLDQLIDLMTELLAYEKENGLLWNLVYDVMSNKTPEQIAAFIHLNDSLYWSESPVKSAQSYRETLFQAEQFEAFRDKVLGGLDTLIAENSDAAVAEAAKQITTSGNATAEASSAAVGDLTKVNNGTSSGSNGNGSPNTKKSNNKSNKGEKYEAWYSDGSGKTSVFLGEFDTKKEADAEVEKYKKELKQPYEWNDVKYKTRLEAYDAYFNSIKNLENSLKLVESGRIPYSEKKTIEAELAKARKNQPKQTYKYGGMVEETETALLHAKEGVLTVEQTSILRNDILGNKPNSLLNLLMDFRDAYERIPSASAYDSIGTSTSGIVIENATVEMNVSKIANDYDAQRAGEQALEKMLQIARKTSAQNRIGR